jgi:hypothetical protein
MASYDTDVYAWSLETAAALRQRRLDGIDFDSVAEEILDVGKHERRMLESALVLVLLHRLKIKYQPQKSTRSWRLSVLEHRARALLVLRRNPSLQPLVPEVLGDAYELARVRAARQTGLPLKVFPKICEWTPDEVLAPGEPEDV